jgi:hypothetical protein
MTILNPNWCPLEATEYEGYCLDLHANIRSRLDLQCEHATECLQLKHTLDSYVSDNHSTDILR